MKLFSSVRYIEKKEMIVIKKIGIVCVVIVFLIVMVIVGMIFLINDEDGFIGYNESGEEYLQTETLKK